YNKKYFQENGLNEEPKTWDEFIELCNQIQELEDMSPIVVGGNDIWHMGFWFNKMYQDNIIVDDENFIENMYGGEVTWSEYTGAKETFEQYKELMNYVDEGWASTPDSMVTTFLVSDMAAMLYSGTWMFSQIEEADPNFELGWFPVYDKEGKLNQVGGAGTGGWALSKEAVEENPGYQELFDAFCEYFFAPDVYGIYTSALNFIPSTIEMPDMTTSPLFEEVIASTELQDHGIIQWDGRVGYNELPPDFRNFTFKTMVEYLQDTISVEDALSQLDAQWSTSTIEFNPVTGVGIE
ncbi:MAG: ABC transporter substrate-binding protein, partial [Lachnospirales bacterium]